MMIYYAKCLKCGYEKAIAPGQIVPENQPDCSNCRGPMILKTQILFPEEKIPYFSEKLEALYWTFKSNVSIKNFSERDCFKMAIRHFINENFSCKTDECENWNKHSRGCKEIFNDIPLCRLHPEIDNLFDAIK